MPARRGRLEPRPSVVDHCPELRQPRARRHRPRPHATHPPDSLPPRSHLRADGRMAGHQRRRILDREMTPGCRDLASEMVQPFVRESRSWQIVSCTSTAAFNPDGAAEAPPLMNAAPQSRRQRLSRCTPSGGSSPRPSCEVRTAISGPQGLSPMHKTAIASRYSERRPKRRAGKLNYGATLVDAMGVRQDLAHGVAQLKTPPRRPPLPTPSGTRSLRSRSTPREPRRVGRRTSAHDGPMARIWLSITVELATAARAAILAAPDAESSSPPAPTPSTSLATAINDGFARCDHAHLSRFTLTDGATIADVSPVHGHRPTTASISAHSTPQDCAPPSSSPTRSTSETTGRPGFTAGDKQIDLEELYGLERRADAPLPSWGWGATSGPVRLDSWADDDGAITASHRCRRPRIRAPDPARMSDRATIPLNSAQRTLRHGSRRRLSPASQTSQPAWIGDGQLRELCTKRRLIHAGLDRVNRQAPDRHVPLRRRTVWIHHKATQDWRRYKADIPGPSLRPTVGLTSQRVGPASSGRPNSTVLDAARCGWRTDAATQARRNCRQRFVFADCDPGIALRRSTRVPQALHYQGGMGLAGRTAVGVDAVIGP